MEISEKVKELKLKILNEVESRLKDLSMQDISTMAHILNECERDETAFAKTLNNIASSGFKG